MFGYIVIHEPELRVRELALYRSYYCGLCEELHARYGRVGQLTLRYDTTFLALLLTSLYEPSAEEVRESNCLVHPLRRHTSRRNEYTAYAADVTVLLSWYACRDDWEDEQSLRGLVLSVLLRSGFGRASGLYPEKAEVIADCLRRLHALETAGPETEVSPDEAGACFGDLMAELFALRQDEWEPPLRRMGFYLGKFIYLLDAYDDLEKDAASRSFNPLLPVRARMREGQKDEPAGDAPGGAPACMQEGQKDEPAGDAPGIVPSGAQSGAARMREGQKDEPAGDTPGIVPSGAQSGAARMQEEHGFDDYVRTLLTMLMSSCCRAFEALPIVENIDILRNILYAGVWTKFEQIYADRTGTGLPEIAADPRGSV